MWVKCFIILANRSRRSSSTTLNWVNWTVNWTCFRLPLLWLDLRIHWFDHDQYWYCPSVSSKIRMRTSILQRHSGQLNFQFNMTKVRGNTLVRLMNTLVKSSIQWRTRWWDLVSWPTVFTLGLRPYEINHSSMNTKAKKNNNNNNKLTFSTKRF